MSDGKIRVRHAQYQEGGRKSTFQIMRVAAYCRVSTDLEEQENSYEAQCLHYTNVIKENPSWALAGIYADYGQSGTTVSGREQFHKLIDDCEAGLVDLILTKSISRFARNTVDCLNYIRKLKVLGVAIYFEKENINTLDVSGELLTTIMASIAQQESESISKNVQMGIQFSFQQGKARVNYTYFLGYTKDRDTGKLVIVPEEAEIVRRIYREYLEGYSKEAIARRFNNEAVRTPTGTGNWYGSTVISILQNEKYCGDLLLQKTYVVDVLTHKKVKNDGRLPQYFIEDDHDPIVPKAVFRQVQGEILRRASLKLSPKEIRFSTQYILQGRLKCGKCGRMLKHVRLKNGLDEWHCQKRASSRTLKDRQKSTTCDCRFVREEEAEQAILAAINELPRFRRQLKNRRSEIKTGPLKHFDAELAHVEKKIEQIEDKQSDIAKDGVDKNIEALMRMTKQLEELAIEKKELMIQRAEVEHESTQIRFLLELMESMNEKFVKNIVVRNQYGACRQSEILKEETSEPKSYNPACFDAEEFFQRTRHDIPESMIDSKGKMTVFDNDLVIRYIDLITVHDAGYQIKFKAGPTITIHI